MGKSKGPEKIRPFPFGWLDSSLNHVNQRIQKDLDQKNGLKARKSILKHFQSDPCDGYLGSLAYKEASNYLMFFHQEVYHKASGAAEFSYLKERVEAANCIKDTTQYWSKKLGVDPATIYKWEEGYHLGGGDYVSFVKNHLWVDSKKTIGDPPTYVMLEKTAILLIKHYYFYFIQDRGDFLFNQKRNGKLTRSKNRRMIVFENDIEMNSMNFSIIYYLAAKMKRYLKYDWNPFWDTKEGISDFKEIISETKMEFRSNFFGHLKNEILDGLFGYERIRKLIEFWYKPYTIFYEAYFLYGPEAEITPSVFSRELT